MPPPPTPFHILRTHHAPLSCLSFNASNTLLLAGDQDGYLSVTDLRLRRVVAYWKGHEGGVLGVGEWAGRLIR
jgi:WD40 repeat protein